MYDIKNQVERLANLMAESRLFQPMNSELLLQFLSSTGKTIRFDPSSYAEEI